MCHCSKTNKCEQLKHLKNAPSLWSLKQNLNFLYILLSNEVISCTPLLLQTGLLFPFIWPRSAKKNRKISCICNLVTMTKHQDFYGRKLWKSYHNGLGPISVSSTLCMQSLKWLKSLKSLPTRPREGSGRLVISLPRQWSLSSPISRKGPKVSGKRKLGPFRIKRKYF